MGKPKSFQFEEDTILAEVTLSTIYRRMPLIWKGVEEASWVSTRSFKPKETTLELGGSLLKESGMLPCAKGTKLKMLRTWSKDSSPPKRRVGLTEDYINNVTSLDLSLSKRRVGSNDYCIDHFGNQILIRLLGNRRWLWTRRAFRQGPCFLYHGNTRTQMSKVISFAKLTRELGIVSYISRFLNRISAPNMTCSGWWVSPYYRKFCLTPCNFLGWPLHFCMQTWSPIFNLPEPKKHIFPHICALAVRQQAYM